MRDFDDILREIRQPGRYLGCEINARRKDPDRVLGRVALAYPDRYELGMSYLGLQVLYAAVNREADLWAERVFAPDHDMEAALTRAGLELASLESRTPLRKFDLIGFTLQHELTYLDVLAMLRLGSIPLRAEQREPHHPFVVAGGPCASNPEPLAPAFDAVFLGDAEEGLVEMARIVGRGRRRRATRSGIMDELMALPGVYLPGRYEAEFDAAGNFAGMRAREGAPARVRRRLIADINAFRPPEHPVVPSAQTVHDRLAIEIQRGCTRGCRFCHAGMINRPVRQRHRGQVLSAVARGLERTGHDQVSFLSLSAGDHPGLLEMLRGFFARHGRQSISASLPSLRAETLTSELAGLVSTVRKSGFTIAPEAGSERLRGVINKQLRDDEILEAAGSAFEAGWRLIKLYFMVGLPTERDADHDAIVALVERIRTALARLHGPVRIHVGVSTFVPKPHTPFQWERMVPPDRALGIHHKLRRALARIRGVKTGWTRTEMSWAEGVLARGDRRLYPGLEALQAAGRRLAGWSEHFRENDFRSAFAGAADAALDERAPSAPLPWDHLDMGPTRDFLLAERERAYAGIATPDCAGFACHDCGACTAEGVVPVLDDGAPEPSPEPAAAPSPGAPSRIRLSLSKTGEAVHLSHLEFMQAILRALRRAGWPLATSQGFHPKPRVSFGPACPVGVESLAELVDVGLSAHLDGRALDRLREELPAGIGLLGGRILADREPGIMKEARAVRYRIRLGDGITSSRAVAGARALMEREEWTVTRQVKGRMKTVDVRPTLLSCEIVVPLSDPEAVREIALYPGSSARPAEVVREAFGDVPARITRETLVFGAGHDAGCPS